MALILPVQLQTYLCIADSEADLSFQVESMERLGWKAEKAVYTYKTAHYAIYSKVMVSAIANLPTPNSPRMLIQEI